MNRAHTSVQAKTCLEAVASYFANFSIDMIYGLPSSDVNDWSENLSLAIAHAPAHMSCYALTVEPQTALSYQVKTGKVRPASDQMVINQFYHLIDQAALAGYEHYEISNFSLTGKQAIHNSNYWAGSHYLGVGPSAHSYDGSTPVLECGKQYKVCEVSSCWGIDVRKRETR